MNVAKDGARKLTSFSPPGRILWFVRPQNLPYSWLDRLTDQTSRRATTSIVSAARWPPAMDSSSPKTLRPRPSAAIYITPPPNPDRLSPVVNLYRQSPSPSGGGGSRPHSPLGRASPSGSRTPTPGNSRSGSPVPRSGSSASKHNHSIQDLVKLITKKVGAARKPKESLSATPSPDSRRTSCFLEVPKDASQFRGRSKSLDDGATRKQPPSVDSATAYKIYDQILQEGILSNFYFRERTVRVIALYYIFFIRSIPRELVYSNTLFVGGPPPHFVE